MRLPTNIVLALSSLLVAGCGPTPPPEPQPDAGADRQRQPVDERCAGTWSGPITLQPPTSEPVVESVAFAAGVMDEEHVRVHGLCGDATTGIGLVADGRVLASAGTPLVCPHGQFGGCANAGIIYTDIRFELSEDGVTWTVRATGAWDGCGQRGMFDLSGTLTR